MKISELNLAPIYFNRVEPRGGLIANGLSASNFSSMLNSIIVDQTVSTKDSDTSCDCDNTEKCKCNSGKETEEVYEAKKTGIAACMECPNRTNGQCDMWNGEDENSAFDLFSVNSHDNVAQASVAKISDIQTQLDVIAKVSTDYDYTNAYAYVSRKNLGILMSD